MTPTITLQQQAIEGTQKGPNLLIQQMADGRHRLELVAVDAA